MNIFRFIADMLHLAAILLLLYRIRVVRNCIGKSPGTHSGFCHLKAASLLELYLALQRMSAFQKTLVQVVTVVQGLKSRSIDQTITELVFLSPLSCQIQ